ncbi:MAG: ABC transporter ATP-binding protein [Solirubrobacteraceae bacterium]|nr:ABC transporter ATP-binding protein [Solirubrobacteraceae bacterium]
MATDQPIITLRGVTKKFGAKAAVDDISVDVLPGRCFAWLGPNGCGKTTLIRMMLGLARPTAGEITVRGFHVPKDSRRALSRVGAIVEEPRFYPYLSGRDNLKIWAAHYDASAAGRIDSELARVGLTEAANQKVDAYSLGMRQRLGVARAMLNDPELLLLDEPTNGLDPAGLVEFRQMVRSLVAEGRTVFISSHILDEVERMADDVAIIQHGRMVSVGSIAELTQGASSAILVRVSDPQAAASALSGLPFVERADAGDSGRLTLTVSSAGDAELQATAAQIVGSGIGLFELGTSAASLESRFLEITGTSAGELGGGGTFASREAGAPGPTEIPQAPPPPGAPPATPTFHKKGQA